MVRAKKHLGQHFLRDLAIAEQIVNLMVDLDPKNVLEIGPGEGVLTDFLLNYDSIQAKLIEIDSESVDHLLEKYAEKKNDIIEGDFLQMNVEDVFQSNFAIIGNFPYNISSQIMFKIFENKSKINAMVGMFQKEVAERIASGPGSKVYGILSVLIQLYYDVSYEFTVPPEVFDPPPKVESGVIKLTRNDRQELEMTDLAFKKIVKLAFGQRRKTLRNSLASVLMGRELPEKFQMQRPEQLGVEEFIELATFCYDQ